MAKKRTPRRRGQIVQRGPETFLVRVYRGTTPEGKKKYTSETIKGTRKDAEKALTSLLSRVDSGEFIETPKDTLADYLRSWLDTKTRISASTKAGYRDRIEKDVIPFIGHMKLGSVQPVDIQRLYHTELLRNRGISGRTIRYTHVVLNQAMKQAVRLGLLARNPCEHVEIPTAEPKEIKTWTPEQVHLFLERTKGTPKYPMWLLFLTTGMRPQEVAGLKWSDLQEDGTLIIQRAIRRVPPGSHVVYNMTKTRSGMRRISLPRSTVEALKAHRVAQLEQILQAGEGYNRSGNWMFPTATGGHTNGLYILRSFTRAVKKAGLPHIRLYDLRHTHAAVLLLNGTNPKIVQERLGHSTVELTLDVYSHVTPEIQAQTAEVVERIFTRQETGT